MVPNINGQVKPVASPCNPAIPAEAVQFLQALGRHDLERVRVRGLPWQGGGGWNGDLLTAPLHRWNDEGRSIYFIVARTEGGDTGEHVKELVAVFIEWDNCPIAEQLAFDWSSLGFPAPPIQVTSGGKSLHCYWPLSEPCPNKDRWERVMKRMIAAFKSDPVIHDTARIMRLPGFRYWYTQKKAEKAGVEPGTQGELAELVKCEQTTFTLDELEAALAAIEEQKQPAESQATATTPAPQQRRRRTEFEVYPPDSLEDIQAALACIPPRIPGSETYEEYRNSLWGLCAAVEKAGYDRAIAAAMMAAHSPAWAEAEGGSLERIANSTRCDISPGAFWRHAYKNGYRPSHWRNDSPGTPRRPGSSGAGGGGGGTGGNGGGDGDDDDGDRTRLQRLDPHALVDFIANYYGDRLRWNELTLYVEIDGKPLLSGEIQRYYITLSELGIKASKELAVDALYHAACRNTFNPVTSYLERVAETVEPISIDDLATRYLRPGDSPGSLSDRMLRATLIGAVRRAFEPGAKHDTACVLVGRQGARKSTFWRVLGGEGFDDSLGDLSGKDDLMVLHRSWIQEWGEIDHIVGRRHAGQIKAFLSRANDAFRHPYGRNVDSHPRRGIIVGSTNREEFLSDESGNRRFLPITVTVPGKIDTDRLAAERDAIWAAAVLAYRAGAPNYLDEADEALVCELNEEHLSIHPWQPVIAAWLESAQGFLEAKSRRVTIPRLLTEVVMKPLDHQTKADQMAIADILKRLGWELKRNKGQRWWEATYSAPTQTPEEQAPEDPQPPKDSLGWEAVPTPSIGQPPAPAGDDSPEQSAAPSPEESDEPTLEQISRALFSFDDEERATALLMTPPAIGGQSPPPYGNRLN